MDHDANQDGAVCVNRVLAKAAKANPEIRCHTPHQAATTAMAVFPPKKLKIRIKPNPEFCIPVSMATVRLTASSFLSAALK